MNDTKLPVVKSFLVGSFSGACSTILFQPLDLLKTRLQLPGLVRNSPAKIAPIIVTVLKEEKVFGLWRGLVPSLIRTVPGIGIYFCSLHWLAAHFGRSIDTLQPIESLVLGACSRCVAGLSTLPFTVIKTRYESGFFHYTSIAQALESIYKTEGYRGLFSGLTATLLRDVPFSGLYLMFYTQAKATVDEVGLVESSHRAGVHFGCGVVAGCLASVVTQPPDVIKTHLQLYPSRFNSTLAAATHILQKDGLTGFLRGLVPRLVRRTLMAAMSWTVYEQVMLNLRLRET